ncbi:hypothetical protein ENSA5_23750 [Enhygromyxa salina]|uniref:Uncharacterized protein n=1 Tax=Enhygromyxa salina TaxID=215803 RepID=A0A2S9YB59_9BACT|nr:hypothetical protein ENSA5_23750 [Enhygromyxa salina]
MRMRMTTLASDQHRHLRVSASTRSQSPAVYACWALRRVARQGRVSDAETSLVADFASLVFAPSSSLAAARVESSGSSNSSTARAGASTSSPLARSDGGAWLAARGAMPRAASLGLFAESFVAKTCSTPGTAAFWLRALGKNSGARRHDALPPGLLATRGKDSVAPAPVALGSSSTSSSAWGHSAITRPSSTRTIASTPGTTNHGRQLRSMPPPAWDSTSPSSPPCSCSSRIFAVGASSSMSSGAAATSACAGAHPNGPTRATGTSAAAASSTAGVEGGPESCDAGQSQRAVDAPLCSSARGSTQPTIVSDAALPLPIIPGGVPASPKPTKSSGLTTYTRGPTVARISSISASVNDCVESSSPEALNMERSCVMLAPRLVRLSRRVARRVRGGVQTNKRTLGAGSRLWPRTKPSA